MDPNLYQKLAGRTECDQAASACRFNDNRATTPTVIPGRIMNDVPWLLPVRVNHAALGIAAEGGELLTLVQKWLYYGKPLNVEGFKEELGDVLWYVAEACNALGFLLADVMTANIAKLKVRYPDKYTDEHAAEENRDREKEAEAARASLAAAGMTVEQDGHGFGHSAERAEAVAKDRPHLPRVEPLTPHQGELAAAAGLCCQYCARPATMRIKWLQPKPGSNKPGPVYVLYCGGCSIPAALRSRGTTAPVAENVDYTLEDLASVPASELPTGDRRVHAQPIGTSSQEAQTGPDVPSELKPTLNGLFRDDPATAEGKYLVMRRDGTVPEWPHFVLGAKDPAAPEALRAYAVEAAGFGMSKGYCDGVRRLAATFEQYRAAHGNGDPDKGRHRKDDPKIIELMKQGKSA